jgi:thiamine-phosphate pyrophosphorylase
MLSLPRLYPILDAASFPSLEAMLVFVDDLLAAGVTLLQYRNKTENARRLLEAARRIRDHVGGRARLMMNDRADLCLSAGYDGVHVGQDDLSPSGARRVIGPALWLGVSTHNPEQLREADATTADYLAIGPVFSTSSKANPDPLVGLEGVRRARALSRKPVVAIGGITLENARSVIDAGADSVAAIAALRTNPRKSAEEFLRVLG